MFRALSALTIAAAVITSVAAQNAAPSPRGVTLASAGDVTLTSIAGTVALDKDATRSVADRDTIATGARGAATLSSSLGWSAALGASARATLRTEAVSIGASPVYQRVLALEAGSLTWTVSSKTPVYLRTPVAMIKAQDAVKLKVDFVNGKLTVETEEGTVQVQGNTAHVQLKTGQRVMINYSPGNQRLHFVVLEDNGQPIDIQVGKVTIHATEGDEFSATVFGEHMDIAVDKGVVVVTGPDQSTTEVSAGSTETIVGGAVGFTPPTSTPPDGQKDRDRKTLPKEPTSEPFQNKSEVSPS
jgi:hypothetical protein